MLFSTERAVSQLCAWLEQVDKKDGTGGVHGRIVTSDDAAQVTTIYLATVTCFYCGLDVRRRHLCCLQQFAVSQNKDRRIGCIFGLSFVDVVTFLLDCSRHDIAEILWKLALNINQSYQMLRNMSTLPTRLLRMSSVLVGVAWILWLLTWLWRYARCR